jgi:uncharacterized circularly permuted ATP-grasp superfamily protein/uncharacterized alpha-E superfamily protein
MPARTAAPPEALDALLAGYRPRPGVSDELFDGTGGFRPVWREFIADLAGMTPEDLRQRTQRGDHYLRDAGVYYRQYGAGVSAERDWPLSHIPVLIDETDWARITRGLVQRADLLEAVLADLYGENRLAAEGHLPAGLIAASPEWLRPLVGVVPRGGHFLNFIAFEIGRGPDGGWWVLGDRTQAPSGVGFALQNRLATARVFADHYAQARVHRLAGFFRHFRDALNGLRDHDSNRVAILTPGPLNETYYEHAYIARYLGFALLEGEDMTVEDGRLMVRTVAGLVPIDVIWRRLDSGFADPLELDPSSRLGTPGLVGAVRRGSVTLVNALGSGILEIRAMPAFLPRLAERLLGERLLLPNIATWWCGDSERLADVRRRVDRLTVADALATGLSFEHDPAVSAGLADPFRSIGNGAGLVAQEVATLSTTPALVDGALAPRPMILRVFLARTPEGWRAMPGGFARIGQGDDPAAVAMRRGGAAADVWIVSRDAVPNETMLASAGGTVTRAMPGTLPSRAADNLFWLGRYVERTEGHLRLLRALHLRYSEDPEGGHPTVALLGRMLADRSLDPAQALPEGVLETIDAALASAAKIRDRFSVDGWTALNDLSRTARRLAPRLSPGDDMARAAGMLLRKVSGFSGLVHENMYRFLGWRFMSIGRSLERAQSMLAALAALTGPDAPEGAPDLAVEIADSAMSHRRRYAIATTRGTVIDLLALDPLNPRSVLFAADEIVEHIGFLPGVELQGQKPPLIRAALRFQADLAVATPEDLDAAAFEHLRGQAFRLSDLVAEAYFP